MTSYLDELFGLTGRTAVVTGGSSGIGREIALGLGRAGARVVLVARRPEPLAEVVAELEKIGAEAGAVTADLADRGAVREAIAEITSRYGEPDVLVNSAGVNLRPPLGELTDDVWDLTLAANLTAPFLLGQAFGPAMTRRGWGRIINLVSQQAFRAYGNSGAYGAAKAGLVGLTRSQAEAWSPHGVCCNAIAPGVVHTPLTEAVFADPTKVAAHAARTMIGRNGLPEDFVGCAVFLASGASQAVTGQTLFVDGGYSAT
ncbi:gluconate 5-dehydrogenase [Actinoplanes octamycinicus]|uniref:Gluconate 5-dehydrogenase n=1 Tax=Actinoplanes octamycinicus TaxID=135948 RepID=A0A7W7GV15_9ACTN|nr:SDR family oxidoreductase [Actinoplanes octamycinicus]MBB4738747.1 gluconate 5-dehydrogenase [Actinoplanes octamycinicus]GIE61481.1 gluconate 5-dehydrogenase [Actinoplanes octamycinicus]